MKVVILASGSASRMGDALGEAPNKPWLRVGDMTLMERTYRLAAEHGVRAGAVVLARAFGSTAPTPVLLDDLGRPIDPYLEYVGFLPHCETVVERVEQVLAHPMADGGVTFLLGDVFYSRAAIRTILTDGTDPAFFGRKGRHPVWNRGDDGEVYALKIGLESLALMRAEVSRLRVGKLRWLHNAMAARHARIGPDLWIEIADYTDDFDVPEDLERIPKMARMALEETL